MDRIGVRVGKDNPNARQLKVKITEIHRQRIACMQKTTRADVSARDGNYDAISHRTEIFVKSSTVARRDCVGQYPFFHFMSVVCHATPYGFALASNFMKSSFPLNPASSVASKPFLVFTLRSAPAANSSLQPSRFLLTTEIIKAV
jgi:hypothetical protein